MSTEMEIAEVQKEVKTSPDSTSEGNQYKIFEYFAEHTGLLVTCISAVVAILSFVIQFAVGRMNYAYLAYWDIASLHANVTNQNELYMVMCVLCYMLALMLIRGFLSKTSDTFRYYVQLLSMVNQGIKVTKRQNRKLRKELRSISIELERLAPEKRESEKGKSIKERCEKSQKTLENELRSIHRVKKARRKLLLWVIIQIIIAIVLSYLLGSILLVFVNMTATIRESIYSSRIIVLFIAADMIGCFVPAYIDARRSSSKYQDEEIFDKAIELIDSENPRFPFENLRGWKIKTILTDKILKSIMVYLSVGMVILLLSMSFIGTLSAEKTRSFPMYTEGTTLYAVVYTSGSTRFMEEAVIQDGTLVIDTTKQRIITSDDISYNIEAFDNVSVIRINGAQKIEPNAVSLKNILDKICDFFETLKTKIGEAMVENEGSVSGTEYQP